MSNDSPYADAFQAVIDHHKETLGLERGHPPEVDLFHFLASALEWCDRQNPVVDFDLVLEQVRQDFRSSGDLP